MDLGRYDLGRYTLGRYTLGRYDICWCLGSVEVKHWCTELVCDAASYWQQMNLYETCRDVVAVSMVQNEPGSSVLQTLKVCSCALVMSYRVQTLCAETL